MLAKRGRKKGFRPGAKAGRKAKPSALRQREGNPGHRAIPPPKQGQPPLKMPVPLIGRELELWNQFTKYATWLTVMDAPLLVTFIKMSVEQEQGRKLSAARLREFRILASQLALSRASSGQSQTETRLPPHVVDPNPFGYPSWIADVGSELVRRGLIGKLGQFNTTEPEPNPADVPYYFKRPDYLQWLKTHEGFTDEDLKQRYDLSDEELKNILAGTYA